MKQTKIGNRVVVITGSLPASGNAGHRGPGERRPTARRIVVIRNGEVVGGGLGR
jgi:hypothetical protein